MQTVDAANIAGWLKVHLLPEPIAAIIAYSYEIELLNESVALVFDCGVRTTQICVAKMMDNKIEILTNNEDPFLGGNDFDARLITYFSSALKHKYGLNVLETNKKYRLMYKCQEIKHTLSVELKDNLYVDDFKVDEDDVISIERKEFEEMAADLILRAKHLIVESLRKAKLKRENINIVFQVGGGCRMPMIKEMLKEMYPKAQHQCSIHPEEIVAKGAALYSYEIKSRNQIDSHVPKNIVIVKDDDHDVGDSHASVSSTEANPENYHLKDEQQRNTRQLFS
uniref:Hypoxia up-regulated protein 1 n=1 Tax=Panagrolaimus davidi TaxID=227884 RepID=A0A914R2D7_9BILA